uniref:Uncharacterized protein n=1 Tax=Arundo donax TaxID=35708 RepID=A0A0A9A3E0_ARUDO
MGIGVCDKLCIYLCLHAVLVPCSS